MKPDEETQWNFIGSIYFLGFKQIMYIVVNCLIKTKNISLVTQALPN